MEWPLQSTRFLQVFQECPRWGRITSYNVCYTKLLRHLFLGILREGEGIAIDVMVTLGANLYELRKEVENSLHPSGPIKVTHTENIPLLKSSERILKLVYLEAKSLKKTTIDTGHLLLAILKEENDNVPRVLQKHQITYNTVRMELEKENQESIERTETRVITSYSIHYTKLYDKGVFLGFKLR